MKSYPTLPQGYVPFASIDLLHNKKQFWIVNGLSIALCVLMLIPPFLWGYSLFLAVTARCPPPSSVWGPPLWGCLLTSPCTS